MKPINFTIEETKSTETFKAICRVTYNYEDQLTEGKIYSIKMEGEILVGRPLCSFIDDGGKASCAHVSRFEKHLDTIYQAVKALNIPYSTHCSDLYIPVNETTTELVKRYFGERDIRVATFINQVEGGQWYDLTFAYDDYRRK